MSISTPQWATKSGDVWAERWRDTDRGLSGLAPALHSALLAAAPPGPFTALDVGCGPGSTTIDLAAARQDARIIACDLSPALAQVAGQRLGPFPGVEVVLGDAQAVALERGPFDLTYSRHGVMFFADPVAAFTDLRRAARERGSLVFSCFQGWSANPWASEIATAAAGRALAIPGREPGAFAFADLEYARGILDDAGWKRAEPAPIDFRYAAGQGAEPVAEALSFLCAIGPAARIIDEMPAEAREQAVERMRRAIEAHCVADKVEFEAAAWIWTAKTDA